MGRVAKQIVGSVWFVPDIGENRRDPEPFRVELRPLTGAEYAALRRDELAKADAKATGLEVAASVTREVFVRAVGRVEGYELRLSSGEVRVPKTGEELFDAVQRADVAELEVIDQIFEAAKSISRLEEGALGKSASLSDSSQAGTAQSTAGAVPGADEVSKTTSAPPATATERPRPASPSPSPPSSVVAHGAS